MASILDRYGIKEVADVTFYTINKTTGQPEKPVLYLDTLKVSTIEQTAESVDARGGKGNPKLVTWDYGKEINVTIEDALFSAKSMAIMFGDGNVTQSNASGVIVNRVATVRSFSRKYEDSNNTEQTVTYPQFIVADIYDSTNGSKRTKLCMDDVTVAPAGSEKFNGQITLVGVFDEEGNEIKYKNTDNELVSITSADGWRKATTGGTGSAAGDAWVAGNKYVVKYTVKAITKTISVGADTFPGTYYVQGDTYARSDVDGSDQFFQFIIPKAKMTSENTITLEAEGDPAVFNMNLTVLRPEDGEMMKLVQYDLVSNS